MICSCCAAGNIAGIAAGAAIGGAAALGAAFVAAKYFKLGSHFSSRVTTKGGPDANLETNAREMQADLSVTVNPMQMRNVMDMQNRLAGHETVEVNQAPWTMLWCGVMQEQREKVWEKKEIK